MKKHLYILLIFCCQFANAQQSNRLEKSIMYIQDYYSTFRTGYDFDGKFIAISENYKATFSDSHFILTFDTFDENKKIQKKTISINLKKVIGIEPNGTDVVEIHDSETAIVPISGKLAFITKKKSYDINVYYEVDEDVEQTRIYKAFNDLIKSNHTLN